MVMDSDHHGVNLILTSYDSYDNLPVFISNGEYLQFTSSYDSVMVNNGDG